MKRLIFILIVLLATIGLFSCSKAGMDEIYTPPIATPNQNIPLYEYEDDQSSQTQSPDTTGPSTEPETVITATPSTIYIQGSGGVTDSKIKVASGTFDSNSYVEVYGETANLSAVESPPLIPEDMLASEEGSQLTTDSEGGVEFTLRAGKSAGVFIIIVAEGNNVRAVTVTILE